MSRGNSEGLKIKSLHIEEHKMFKDFDIDFMDKKGEPLPIVVIAGVNGSGKTTLLECLIADNTIRHDIDGKTNILNILPGKGKYKSIDKNLLNIQNEIKKHFKGKSKKQIFFFQAGIDDIDNVKSEFVKSFYHFLKNHDYRPSEVKTHFHKYMTDIFVDIDLTFQYSHLDKDDNVWFTNNYGEEFMINELSTGEKTLLSKVLYLFFQDYKNKVILIDEPELSLHPSWQNKVLKIYENFAKVNNCQVIIATHSPHIIGSTKNEYLRILRKNDEGNIEVVKDLKAEGRDINSILFDVMGEVAYRPREFDDKIDRLYIAIDDKKFDEANQRLDELKNSYGEDDAVVMEAQMLIDMFSRDE